MQVRSALVVPALLAAALALTGCSDDAPADREPVTPVAAAVPVDQGTVPTLTGATLDEARLLMRQAGFRTLSVAVDAAPAGAVIASQDPAPQTRGSRTEPVTVRLSTSAPVATPTPTPTTAAPTTTIAPPPTTTAAPASQGYTYEVTGSNRGMITWTGENGNISQETDARLPWSTTVERPGYTGMTFASVSAQNSGGGTISCRIIGPSGNVISENSSRGEYAIVTCQS